MTGQIIINHLDEWRTEFGNHLNCMAAKIIIVTSIKNVLESSLSCYLVLVMFKCKLEWGVQFSGNPFGSHIGIGCSVLETKRTRSLGVTRAGTGPWAGIEGGPESEQRERMGTPPSLCQATFGCCLCGSARPAQNHCGILRKVVMVMGLHYLSFSGKLGTSPSPWQGRAGVVLT